MKFRFYPFCLVFAILMVSCDDDTTTAPTATDIGSAFAAQLYEYEYAPGQHIKLLEKSPSSGIEGSNKHNILLGGWGGYIVVGFDHDVENTAGEDIIIYCGNSVSPEPGVIYVMADENNNSLPDDTWYEIRGSETDKPGYIRNYAVTYYKPANDSANVRWIDNQGAQNEMPGSASWWWHTDLDSVRYTGVLICTDAYFNQPQANGQQYWAVAQGRFTYGYAENGPAPDRSHENGFLATDYDADLRGNRIELDSAIDAQGQPVFLPAIRFVKVQTGVFQQAGWLGEISTEINGIADLHLLEQAEE